MGAITNNAQMLSVEEMAAKAEPPSQQHIQAQELAANETKCIAEMSGNNNGSGNCGQPPMSNTDLWKLIAAEIGPRDPVAMLGADVGNLPGPQPTQLGVDPYVVSSYVDALRTGQSVPQVEVVVLPDGRQFLLEGHHRYVASQKTGIDVPQRVTHTEGPVGFNWGEVKYERLDGD